MGSVGRARAWEGGVLQQPRGSGSRQGSPRGARGRGRPPAAVLRAGHSVGDVLPRASGPAPLPKRPCPCLWGAGRDPQTPRPPDPPAIQDAAVRARVRSQCLDLYGRKGGSASGPCRGPGGRRRPGPGTPGEDAGFQTEWECLCCGPRAAGGGLGRSLPVGRCQAPGATLSSRARLPRHLLSRSLQAGPGPPPCGWLGVTEDGPAGLLCPWRRQALPPIVPGRPAWILFLGIFSKKNDVRSKAVWPRCGFILKSLSLSSRCQ